MGREMAAWRRAAVVLCWALLASCGGEGGGSVNPPAPPSPHTVGGAVAGSSGTVVLTNNGGDNLVVSGNGSFTFPTPLSSSASYSVGILSQPANQQCAVSGATGTMGSADVTNVVVTCVTVSFTVGGTVSGLAGTIMLQNNSGDNLVLSANGPFVFATASANGAPYQVTVSASPPNQQCVVFSGSGTISSADVGNISVACFTPNFSIGGTVSGLAGTLVLRNNGGDDLTHSSNGPFSFATLVANGAMYNVTVASKPATQVCTVASGSGRVAGAPVVNVSVSCTTPTFTVGGTVSGLVGTVVLRNNGGDDRSVSANGPFSFATPLLNGSTYQVSVITQPVTQQCTVTSGSGTISSANIANVNVTCVRPTFTVGGTVAGLTGTVVLRNNGGDDLTLSGDGPFTFTTPIPRGATYLVSILSKPQTQHCGVKSGGGTIASAAVTNVKVTCVTFREGKYAYVRNNDATISQYRIGADGGLIPLAPATVAAGTKPLKIAVDPSGRYVYLTNIDSDILGTGSILQYAIGADGTLSPLVPATVGAGANPLGIAVDPSGTHVYVANRGGSSASSSGISQYAIGADGTLTPLTPAQVAVNGSPGNIAMDPGGRHAYVTTIFANDAGVVQYDIGGDGTLSTTAPPESGGDSIVPASVAVDPFDRYVYVTETLFGTVHQYAIDENGGLVSLGRVFNATNLPGTVAIHPAGTNVYIGSGTISLFSIGSDGTLAPMTPAFIVDNGGPTGPDAIDPAGRYLYATIQRGPIGGVTQYRIEADGTLTPLTTVDTGPIPGNMAISP